MSRRDQIDESDLAWKALVNGLDTEMRTLVAVEFEVRP